MPNSGGYQRALIHQFLNDISKSLVGTGKGLACRANSSEESIEPCL